MKRITLLCTTLGFIALSLPSHAAYKELEAVEGGTVTGSVKLTKPAPKLPPKKVTKDNPVCGQQHPDETYVVGAGGGFANVVVFIDGIAEGKKVARPDVELDQKNCRYVPHVSAFPKGTKVVLRSSDAVLHNVHSYNAANATLFNLAIPIAGMKLPKVINQTGPVRYGCDAGHTWMSAWMYVTEHPYVTVTDGEGKFTIGDVPPGTYTIKTWHEVEGEKTGSVTVTRGGTANIEIRY